MAPIDALRAWMLLFVDYIAAKHIIAAALNTFVGGARSCMKVPGSDPGGDRGACEARNQEWRHA